MPSRHPELRTVRLRLRQWRDADLDPLAEMDADPEVVRHIGDGSPATRERTAAALARVRTGWDERGYGLFAAEETATGELIGWVGLAVLAYFSEVMPTVEIGWRLRRRSWGRGYATEAAREVLAFAFGEVRLDHVVSICHVDNHVAHFTQGPVQRPVPEPGHGPWIHTIDHHRGDRPGVPVDTTRCCVPPGTSGRIWSCSARPT